MGEGGWVVAVCKTGARGAGGAGAIVRRQGACQSRCGRRRQCALDVLVSSEPRDQPKRGARTQASQACLRDARPAGKTEPEPPAGSGRCGNRTTLVHSVGKERRPTPAPAIAKVRGCGASGRWRKTERFLGASKRHANPPRRPPCGACGEGNREHARAPRKVPAAGLARVRRGGRDLQER